MKAVDQRELFTGEEHPGTKHRDRPKNGINITLSYNWGKPTYNADGAALGLETPGGADGAQWVEDGGNRGGYIAVSMIRLSGHQNTP